jgi:hypothetical protein
MATADLPQGSGSSGSIRLHHGTDEDSANDILNNGLSRTRAASQNVTGECWVTTNASDADTFAQVNPAGGIPARYSFDLPLSVLAALLSSNPPRAYQHGADWYEFLPASYPTLNREMVNCQVVSPVP